MSDPVRIALVGASGLIGRTLIERAVGRSDVKIVAIARREMPLPRGARMELHVADPAGWGDVLATIAPDVLVSALGTTWRKAGRSEETFRAVDETLVLDTARAARSHGIERMIAVSSAGADYASRNFYLQVKGEVDRDLSRLGFKRLDILRPGLLRGRREGDRRLLERLGIVFAPLTNLFMHGRYRAYRSVKATMMADAIFALAMRRAGGRFTHDPDSIARSAASLAPVE
ncbi:NAD(P)H-binding protein [Tsuneonella mangrovi]|uniref:NAD(P)H-binding protein n=1 Tax=Tsuneonella mangrovi TaxID=1982042 RepID=UPI000BA2839F|nr:NAD(P)H-binding protein [Tsuneonella mangrovi]